MDNWIANDVFDKGQRYMSVRWIITEKVKVGRMYIKGSGSAGSGSARGGSAELVCPEPHKRQCVCPQEVLWQWVCPRWVRKTSRTTCFSFL